jgi:cytochrome c oxidase cbb3-type subunit 4
MMDFINNIQAFWTVIVFIAFIGIVAWAWSSKRKKDFSEAANLIFDDEDASDLAGNDKKSGEHKNV